MQPPSACFSPLIAADRFRTSRSVITQVFGHVFEWNSFGLDQHRPDPDHLHHHHQTEEEEEDMARGKRCDCCRKGSCDERSEYPMREAADCLALGAMTCREKFSNEHPDDRTLTEAVRRDEHEDTQGNYCIITG